MPVNSAAALPPRAAEPGRPPSDGSSHGRFGTPRALRSCALDNKELQLIGPLVAAGTLPADEANECLREWQELRKAGKNRSLLGLFVKCGLLTRTQVRLLAGIPLEQHQPFAEYRLLRKVDEGGMAVVYEAAFKELDARVALKILKTEFCLQEAYRLRFKREAGILLALSHPNIVEGREYNTADGVDYCAMGFVDGVSVEVLLEQGASIDEGLALHIAAQVASALQHMHEKGVVHRDVKPSNFILDEDGTIRMIDFGLARVVTGMRQDTAEEVTVGTVEYMSPEQCRGGNVDIRSDVYSLGVSLFHMVTGELPFTGSQQEIMFGHVKRDLEFTASQRAKVSPPVQFVLQKTMAKDPVDRYPTPQAMLDDMNALAGDLMGSRGPVPTVVREKAIEAAPLTNGPARLPTLKSTRLRPTERGRERRGDRSAGRGSDRAAGRASERRRGRGGRGRR